MDVEAVACTTSQVLTGAPICRVVRDDDGDWQIFELGGPHRLSDGRVVHLRHLTEMDPTVLELRDLQVGYEGVRDGPDTGWTVRKGQPST